MSSKLSIPLSIIIIILISSCRFGPSVKGNGKLTTESRTVRNASKIAVVGSIDVVLRQGERGIIVEADENLLPYILTELDGEWLEVKFKENVNINSGNAITVFVTTPDISQLKTTGSGSIISEDEFTSDSRIAINIKGSGDIKTVLNAPEVTVKIAGSGSLNIAGETKDVTVDIAGSGDFKGENLKAENASVKIAGSGNAILFADVKLTAKILGSGDVKYRGNASVSQKVMGSGSIVRLN